LKTIYAYKNTNSSAGSPTKYEIDPKEVRRVNSWVNVYGNPSFGFHMSNGDTYLLIDDYGAPNGLSINIFRNVNRKKDLV
jgi:hypothetical protein